MSANPTLIYIPDVTFEELGELGLSQASVCCNSHIDVDGTCFQCELTAPVPMPYVCSNCRSYVYDIHPDSDGLFECAGCGSRWAEIPGYLEPSDIDGMAANAWNPASLPDEFAHMLGSYNRPPGHQTRPDSEWNR